MNNHINLDGKMEKNLEVTSSGGLVGNGVDSWSLFFF